MSDILEKITTYKRAEVADAKARRPLPATEAAARAASPVRGFKAALTGKIAAGRLAVIGEIKKASPSKGLIREDFDPGKLAQAYEAGGAACLSVLTDGPSFRGSPEHLVLARAGVALPVLRKDFMVDRYQVVEARALGADCILIIMAAINDATAAMLADCARDWGMDWIAEVHEEAELERALRLDCPMIGINNRNLKTFHTTLATSEALSPKVPADRLVIAESGISGPADLQRLAKVGVRAFLVGESLMRHADVAAATRALIVGGEGTSSAAMAPSARRGSRDHEQA
jgi:indole-3-glycerol phosphate synthase